MRYPGVISTRHGDTDTKRFTGVCYYDVSTLDFEQSLHDAPIQAWRAKGGRPTYDMGTATYRSVDSFPFDTHEERIEAIRWLDLHNYGLRYSSSALLDHMMRRHVKISQLDGVYWGIGLAAVHQGHMSIFRRGQVTYSAINDIKQAYLNSMDNVFPPTLSQPVKLAPDEYPESKHIVDGWEGVVSAWWSVPKSHAPFIPSNVTGQVIYPYGEVYSTMTGDMAREAIRQGCEIIEVRRAMAYLWRNSGHHFAELADAIRRLPKAIAKPIYTRFFGSMCGTGHYYYSQDMLDAALEEREDYAPQTEHYRFHDSVLPWEERTIFTGHEPRSGFRPDIAAAIAASPAVMVGKELHRLGEHALLSHVDSVVTDGPTIDDNRWAVKGSGAYIGCGIGNYVCGDKIATAGRPVDIPISTWLDTVSDTAREWRDDGTSEPKKVGRDSYLLKH